jgi:hypothetical protein
MANKSSFRNFSLSTVKKINLSTAFYFVMVLHAVINFEITGTELPHNIISSLNKSFYLDHWQIVKDSDPKLPLSSFPDSLWQSFQPTLDDDRYTEGNWLIRTKIVIKDSVSDKEILGLFPLNFVTAYEIYRDGIRIAQNGRIGINKTDEKTGAYNFNLALSHNFVKCESLDNQIDKLVYVLDGLTEEENRKGGK